MALIVVLLALAAGLYASAPHPPVAPKHVNDVAEMEAWFLRLVKSSNPPGLSVVVVKDGQLAYNRAFGYADGPRALRAEPETAYHWWSMTKIPTALAIMQLSEQAKLRLDDPVRDYLPWFEVKYPSADSPAITIRHLLQHTSGLPDTMPAMIGWVHYDDSNRNQTEITKRHLPEFARLKFEPGKRAKYSNLNYMLLGAVIEAASGESYEAYVSRHLLEPLGMARTSFLYTRVQAQHEAAGTLPVVHPYTPLLPGLLNTRELVRERRGKLLWLNRVYVDATPSTGLIGPAPDVARLMMAYLNGGTLDGGRILEAKSVSLLTDTAPIDGHGLGWFVGETEGSRYLEHAGGGPGFATFMRLYPSRKLGMAVLANGTDLDRQGIADLLASVDW